jgi:hypothetical protein
LGIKNLFFTLEGTMNTANRWKIRSLLTVMVAAALAYGSPAKSAAPDFTVVFPAGSACNFTLQIEGWGSNMHLKEFKDEDGNLVRSILAGTGYAMRYTNLDANSDPLPTFSTKSNGATQHTTYNLDGSYTQKITGHNVLIMFPTDIPAGPSTTLYVGRVVYTVAPDGVFTLQSASGKKTDICAALLP